MLPKRYNFLPCLLFSFVSLWIHLPLLAQDTTFQRIYFEQGQQSAQGVFQASDGYCYVYGNTNAIGTGGSGVLFKVDQNGEAIWNKVYDGPNNESINDMIELPNHDLVMCGYTASFGLGQINGFLTQIDTAGNVRWARYYGGALTDVFHEIVADGSGGFYCAGIAPYFSLTRFDSLGNILWSRTAYIAPPITSLTLTSPLQGPFITCRSPLSEVFYIYHFRPDGNLATSKANSFANPGIDGDTRIKILSLPTNHRLIIFDGANSVTNDSSSDIIVCKMSLQGEILSATSYGGSANENLGGALVAGDGSIMISGWTDLPGNGMTDAFLMRIQSGGDPAWARSYGNHRNDRALSVKELQDGSWGLSGIARTVPDSGGFYFAKVDSNGFEDCSTLPWTFAKSTQPTLGSYTPPPPSPNMLGYTGTIEWNVISKPYLTHRFCAPSPPTGTPEPSPSAAWGIFPNPAHAEFILTGPENAKGTLTLRDAFGRIMGQWPINRPETKVGLADFAQGIYFYTIDADRLGRHSGKLIVR